MIRRNKGQTVIEYTVLIVIILAVFIAMQQYIKRGFQGRMKATVDDFGDQYDPRLVNSLVSYNSYSTAESNVQIVPSMVGGRPGYYTKRTDSSDSTETKNGFTAVGTFNEQTEEKDQ